MKTLRHLASRTTCRAALLAVTTACQGSIGAGVDPGPSRPEESAPGAKPTKPEGRTDRDGTGMTTGRSAEAALARVRRLTGAELQNSMLDLFLPGKAMELPFPSEGSLHKFDGRTDVLGVPLSLVEALQSNAETVSDEAVKSLPALLGCPAPDDACTMRFVEKYGRRAWRRPLTRTETDRLLGVYRTVRAGAPAEAAISAVIQAMLQSPHFVFRTELGTPGEARGPLAPYEVASALSYLLWQSGPDDALLDAAAAGRLRTPADITAEARRLLADPRARRGARTFVSQWLETATVRNASRDPKVYPQFGPALVASMEREVDAFVDDIWSTPDGLRRMFTGTATSVDGNLARLYGLGAEITGATMKRVQLDPAERAGFLTMPAFLTAHSGGSSFSPVFLGLFVRRKILCGALGDPPPDIPALPETKPGVSARERYAMHAAPPCAGCHDAMDPIGFGFEKYDGIGRFREMDGRFRLTGVGRLNGTDIDGPFTGPVELGRKLAGSARVLDCVTGQAFEYALGRDTSYPDERLPIDRRSIDAATERLGGGSPSLSELFLAVATSDSFLLRDSRALPKGGDR